MARADLNVRLGVVIKDFEKSLKRAERSLRKSAQQMSDIGSSLTQAVSVPVAGVGIASLKAAGDIEALEKGLAAVLPASASAADELERLRKIAELPGLGFEQAIRGSVRLQAVGFNADQAAAALDAFGRIVATTGGTAQELDSVVRQITQINAKGRILAEDLNIIQENAPAVSIALQDAFGTTNVEAIRETGISAGEFTQRLIQAVNESEKFSKVNGGLKNALENVGISLRIFLSDLGRQINTLFDVQGLAQRFSETLNRLGTAFKGLDEEQQKNIIRFALLAAAIGPALLAISKFLTIARAVPIVLAATLGPIQAFSAAMITISKVFTIVAIRGKTLAVALRTVGAGWLTAAAPVVGVIAAIVAVAGAFLFVQKNAAAFQIKLTNIFLKLKDKVLKAFNAIVDGINPILSAVGLEIEKAKIEPEDLIDEPRFQTFSEFLSSVKDDLVNLVPGLSSAAKGFSKLKSALFGGGESASPTAEGLGIEGAFENFTGLPGQAGSNIGVVRKELEAIGAAGGLAVIAPPNSIASLTAADERLTQINETMKQSIVDTSEYGSVLSTFSEKFPVLADQITKVGNTIQQGLTVAFEDMFKTLIEGGKNAFGSFANALGDAVKQMLVQLAAAIAQAAILALLINAIFPGAGGFKSVFGGLLKGESLFSFIPGLAEGGIVPSGFPNDTFPARLSSGEAVIPLNRLNSMLDRPQPMVAETVIRGEDIVLSYNRANKTLGR
jgi:tape measure domain-containing protein